MSTNRIIVFGGGTLLGSGNKICLHQTSIERADRAIDYFNENKELFVEKTLARRAFILCTGGYGLLSAGIEDCDPNDREAVLMAKYLRENSDIPKEVIILEEESTSTLTNWTRSLELYADRLSPDLFNPRDKLGLISHPYHLMRVMYLAEKLGYEHDVLEKIPTSEVDNENYEKHVLAVYKEYLEGTNSSINMEERERDLAKNKTLMSYLRSQQ